MHVCHGFTIKSKYVGWLIPESTLEKLEGKVGSLWREQQPRQVYKGSLVVVCSPGLRSHDSDAGFVLCVSNTFVAGMRCTTFQELGCEGVLSSSSKLAHSMC